MNTKLTAMQILFQFILADKLKDFSTQIRIDILYSLLHYILGWLSKVVKREYIAVYHQDNTDLGSTHIHLYKSTDDTNYHCIQPHLENHWCRMKRKDCQNAKNKT